MYVMWKINNIKKTTHMHMSCAYDKNIFTIVVPYNF